MTTTPTTPTPRTEDEIQRAHDVLRALLCDVPVAMSENVQTEVTVALDVLCWVLGHEHNETFATNLQAVEDLIVQTGVMMKRATH